MPVTPTYPGIYIEEVLSTAHTITAAPTSVTVFVGYTHPFKTKPQNYGQAVQIFSFSDYEREFGGSFSVDWLTDDVGQAVTQFFLNGGSVAYVVALRPHFHPLGNPPPPVADIVAPSLTVGDTAGKGIVFTGREPADAHRLLSLSLSNSDSPSSSDAPFDLADIVVSYGTRTETFRKVKIGNKGEELESRIGTADSPLSTLVTVAPAPTGYPDKWPEVLKSKPFDANLPILPFTTYAAADFKDSFADDGSLDKVAVFNLLLTPGVWDQQVVSEALAFCERKRAFMVVDPPADAVADPTGIPTGNTTIHLIEKIMLDAVPDQVIPKSQNGALYFPYLQTADPETGSSIAVPPSGSVAGVIAREDANRGVWKAPAGLETIIANTSGVVPSGRMTDPRQGTLNPIGVNCLRGFPGIGTVVFGARTLVAANPAFQQYRYVNVRRMALFLEQSLLGSLGWVVFESNDVPLWVSIRTTIENFMLGLFHQGAFQGSTPSQAFQVLCDATTTTPDDQANGIVNIVVAFAPLKPAEFVIIKIAQLAGQPQN